jgi:hypothetical protein
MDKREQWRAKRCQFKSRLVGSKTGACFGEVDLLDPGIWINFLVVLNNFCIFDTVKLEISFTNWKSKLPATSLHFNLCKLLSFLLLKTASYSPTYTDFNSNSTRTQIPSHRNPYGRRRSLPLLFKPQYLPQKSPRTQRSEVLHKSGKTTHLTI